MGWGAGSLGDVIIHLNRATCCFIPLGELHKEWGSFLSTFLLSPSCLALILPSEKSPSSNHHHLQRRINAVFPVPETTHHSKPCSDAQSCPTLHTSWTAAHQASLSFTISQSLLKFMSTESVMPPKHLILCHRLLLLPSIFSSIRVFSNESARHLSWPKYCSFSFSISPSKEYSGVISFTIDWFDLLGLQGILKSLLQYQSSKASILWHLPFFMVQFSHPYMTTRKITVGKTTVSLEWIKRNHWASLATGGIK